jgi:virulence-associated protein VapD
MSTLSKEHYSDYFYKLTYNSVYEGSSLQEINNILNVYEELEDYEACEGINKALKEIKIMTLSDFIDKINYIHGRLSH